MKAAHHKGAAEERRRIVVAWIFPVVAEQAGQMKAHHKGVQLAELSPDCVVLPFVQRVRIVLMPYIYDHLSMERQEWIDMIIHYCGCLVSEADGGTHSHVRFVVEGNAPVRFLHVYFEQIEGTDQMLVANFMFATWVLFTFEYIPVQYSMLVAFSFEYRLVHLRARLWLAQYRKHGWGNRCAKGDHHKCYIYNASWYALGRCKVDWTAEIVWLTCFTWFVLVHAYSGTGIQSFGCCSFWILCSRRTVIRRMDIVLLGKPMIRLMDQPDGFRWWVFLGWFHFRSLWCSHSAPK